MNDSLSCLVAEHKPMMLKIALSVVRDDADAEDVVQEAFLHVVRHKGKLHEIHNAKSWLSHIAWNASLDMLRRKKARPATEDLGGHLKVLRSSERPPDSVVISQETVSIILSLFDDLPENERTVIQMWAIDEMRGPEIAASLNITKSSVRSRLYRARAILSEQIDPILNDQAGAV